MSRRVERADVCVIGAGLVGCAAALRLARFKRRVILLERGRANGCASGVNFGGVRRHGRYPQELPLAVRSHAIWAGVRERIGIDCEFTVTGHLRLARTSSEMADLENWAEIGRESGIMVQLLSPRTLATRYPWLREGLAGASYCPDDGHANPRLSGLAFARAAVHAGVALHEESNVASIENAPGGGFRINLTSSHSVESDVIVNAAGAWADAIAANYGDNVPLTPVAPQMFVTEPIRYTITPVIGMVSGALYARQVERGNVILGGGRGIISPDGLRSQPVETTFRLTLNIAQQLIPHLTHVPIIRSWTGIEGTTADGLPVIGESPRRSGLFHAFGFSGHGFQMAPAVGETIAELIVAGRADIDLAPFSPLRFAAHTKGTQ